MTTPKIETTKKNQARLDKALRAFIAGGQTMGDLTKAVADIFGPERAGEIAVTELTRAYAQGDQAAVEELKAQGFNILEVWHTNNDDLVCNGCGTLNGTQRGEDWEDYPPLHPNCRCRVITEMA